MGPDLSGPMPPPAARSLAVIIFFIPCSLSGDHMKIWQRIAIIALCLLLPLSMAGTALAVTSITVTPASASIQLGQTQQFTATDENANNITGGVTTWASSNTAVATIQSTGDPSPGLATAVGPGITYITAEREGVVSDPATLIVMAPPTISAVQAINITDTSATITWKTDQGADSTVSYSSNLTDWFTVTDSDLDIHHAVGLTGLSPATDYYYDVSSTGANGLTTLAPATGYYTFTTLEEYHLLSSLLVRMGVLIDNMLGYFVIGTTLTDAGVDLVGFLANIAENMVSFLANLTGYF